MKLITYHRNHPDYIKTICANNDIKYIYGHFKDDFLSLFYKYNKKIKKSIFTEDSIKVYKENNIKPVYIYDVFDLQNFEYNKETYNTIRKDLDKIVNKGINNILLSNPFLIDLVSIHYRDRLKVIVSNLLDIHSFESMIFFETIENPESINCIELSQYMMTCEKLETIMSAYPQFKYILISDGLLTNNHIINSHYSDLLYGYNAENLDEYIVNLLKEIEEKKIYRDTLYPEVINENLFLKVGNTFSTIELILNNIESLNTKSFQTLQISDFELISLLSEEN